MDIDEEPKTATNRQPATDSMDVDTDQVQAKASAPIDYSFTLQDREPEPASDGDGLSVHRSTPSFGGSPKDQETPEPSTAPPTCKS